MRIEIFGQIEAAVDRFLAQRGIDDFIVRAMSLDDTPIVLILADAQKRLRYSNVLEGMIRQWLRTEVPDFPQAGNVMVFWRYRLESDSRTLDGPIAEQATFLADAMAGRGTPTSAKGESE